MAQGYLGMMPKFMVWRQGDGSGGKKKKGEVAIVFGYVECDLALRAQWMGYQKE